MLTRVFYSARFPYMKTNGIFITGTDTGIGKTIAAGFIIRALKGKGLDVGVMKPVETGCSKKGGELKPHDAIFLKNIAGVNDPLDLINPYRFKEPAAPSAAARLNKKKISLSKIRDCYMKLAELHDFMLVEGAGGLLVPLNNKETILDMIKLLRLPVIIVSALKLGTINHTLLTIKHAEKSGIKILGIIFNNLTPQKKDYLMNMEEIKRFTDVHVIGEIPFIKNKIY